MTKNRTGVDKHGALRRRVADVFRESRGRYGYRRVKAALGTGVSEKVIRGIMREDGLVARVPGRRRYSSYEGEVTPAPDNLVGRDFNRSRAEREMAHGHHAGSRPVTARCTFRQMIDCHDGMVVAHTAGTSPNAEPARHDAGSGPPPTLRPGERPAVSRRPRMPLPVAGMGWTGWAGTAWSGP